MNVSIDKLVDHLKDHMNKTVEHMKTDFAGIRTGKASPALVENIIVDYYDTPVKLRELAGISCPEVKLIVIQPYDPSSVATIEKAINKSNIGINPVSDGKILRLPIPELSEERRATLTKQVSSKAEETRVAVRNIRRDGNELAKKAQKNGEITEDELKEMLTEIQEITNNTIAGIDKVLKSKEEELMKI